RAAGLVIDEAAARILADDPNHGSERDDRLGCGLIAVAIGNLPPNQGPVAIVAMADHPMPKHPGDEPVALVEVFGLGWEGHSRIHLRHHNANANELQYRL